MPRHFVVCSELQVGGVDFQQARCSRPFFLQLDCGFQRCLRPKKPEG